MAIRIDKYLSNAGYGSRKEIKLLIKQKRIQYNNEIIKDPGFKIVPGNEITVDSETVKIVLSSTIMMNKPSGYLSSNVGDINWPSVLELLEWPHPDYKIAGRLDADTTGLLILSTDGNLIHRIISPKKEVQKLYIAEVLPFESEKINLFHVGIKIEEDFTTKPVTHFEIIKKDDAFFTVKIGITEGKYHQVKRMFEAIGSKVMKLHRHSIGLLELDNKLDIGEYRELSEKDLANIFTPINHD